MNYNNYYQIFSESEMAQFDNINIISSTSERVYDSLIGEQICTAKTVSPNVYDVVLKIRKNMTTGKVVIDVWTTETGKQFSPYGLKTPLD